MTDQRYSRQELIQGWDQQRWSKLKAAVVGDGLLAQQIAENLVAMGIGSLKMIGNSTVQSNPQHDGYLSFEGKPLSSLSHTVEALLRKVNPSVSVHAFHWPAKSRSTSLFLEGTDVIFDASGDAVIRQRLFESARKTNTFFVAGAVNSEKGAFAVPREENLSDLERIAGLPGIIPSLVIGGMMVEEARKRFVPYEHERGTLPNTFWYNICSHDRFSEQSDFSVASSIEHKNILCVGAGALGTPLTAAFVVQGVKEIKVLDYDTPNESNLARQIFYYDALGKPKALTLAEKLGRVNPKTRVSGMHAKLVSEMPTEEEVDFSFVTADHIKKLQYDLILSAVDNFQARLLLNSLRRPLVHGGTGYASAKVSLYLPGTTSCPNCLFDFESFAAEEVSRDSCDNVPEPSIITTSKICAGLMAGESVLYLNGADKNHLINGYIAYDTFEEQRARAIRKEQICACGE